MEEKIVSLQNQLQDLQGAFDILSKTNEALNQSWTPIMVLISALSAFLTLTAILAAAVFTYGFTIVRRMKMERRKAAEELQGLVSEKTSLMNKIEKEAQVILKKFENKGESLVDLEKELRTFKEKTEKTVERFTDKALVTVSGLPSSSVASFRFSDPLLGYSEDLKKDAMICSRCGVIFYERPQGYRVRNTYAIADFTFGGPLCKRCREEPGVI